MTLLNPWVLLGGLLSALGLFGGGFWFGHSVASTACVAGQVSAIKNEVTQATRETDRREAVGAAREVSREQINVVYQKIEDKADGYLEKSPQAGLAGAAVTCGLDDDGLRIWNAANAGSTGTLPAEPDDRLPVAAARPVGELGGLAGQPHRVDGDVRAVPGSVAPAGGVREPAGSAVMVTHD